jgi:hypothetical protein
MHVRRSPASDASFDWPSVIMRLGVIAVVTVSLAALAWHYPRAIRDLGRTATRNAELDYLDRELAGGNSVVADQLVMVEARKRIPAHGSFHVAVGEPQDGWSELTAPFVGDFARSFLLPRRVDPDARWVICYACDRTAYPGATVVWDGEAGTAILRRPA